MNSVNGVAIWGEQGCFLKKIAESYFTIFEEKVAYNHLTERQEENYNVILRETLKNPEKWVAWANWYGLYRYKENYRKFIKSFFSPFCGAKHWGFKEIRYGTNDRVLEFLKDIYPKATFIFIIRDSTTVIPSQMVVLCEKSMDREHILKDRIRHWNNQNNFYFEFHQNNKKMSFIVRYEDLISNQITELEKLFAFLNFKISEKPKKVIVSKKGRGATLKKSKQNVLSEKEVQLVLEQTRKVRKIFGYC